MKMHLYTTLIMLSIIIIFLGLSYIIALGYGKFILYGFNLIVFICMYTITYSFVKGSID